MGLDQYAHIRIKSWNSRQYNYEWRKHSRLQEFMEQLWSSKGNTGTFNCQELPLTLDDIKLLRRTNQEGYPDYEMWGRFLLGRQFQEEQCADYIEYDLEFVAKAKEAFDKPGGTVVYTCWW